MNNLLSVYTCSKCGDILEDQVETVEIIDTDHDDVFVVKQCQKCGMEVSRKTVQDEKGGVILCFEQVSDERWLWASGFYDWIFNDFEQEIEYEYNL